METVHGIAVFPGVAIGPAFTLDQDGARVAQHAIPPAQIPAEVARFDASRTALQARMAAEADEFAQQLGPEIARIFDAHRALVADPQLRREVVALIEGQCCSAEFAVHQALGKLADAFRALRNPHFSQRATDMADLERRIVAELVGDRLQALAGLRHDVVVIARDLTPSETVGFDRQFVKGLATATGGRTSHTAIVAGAMEIPAVVGLGNLPQIIDGQTVILDGRRGVLIVDPDGPTLQTYRSFERADAAQAQVELADCHAPAVTRDGVHVRLLANIEFPHEAKYAIERGADGIGLYRTEFLYLSRATPPTEQDHFDAYAEVLRIVGPQRPVVFRTLDLGADKLERHADRKPEANPFLGMRSIRLSLMRNPDLFKTQLRAMLRASSAVDGDVRIMFPMIATLRELLRARLILRDVREDLEEEGVRVRRNLPVGMMVEVPSSALLADVFAPHVDFFSVGTNDLIQYALAVDRTNTAVAPLYSPSDPAVIRLLRGVVQAGRGPRPTARQIRRGESKRRHVPVSVCGEMAGDPLYAGLLIGMGIRQLSVSPHNIPALKRLIRNLDARELSDMVRRVHELESAVDITKYLRRRMADALPQGVAR